MPILRNTIRPSRRERARRIDRAFEFFLRTFLLCYFLFVFSAWLSYREEFRISEIAITGAQAVDASLVRNAVERELAQHLLWKIDRNNFLLYPRWAIPSAIMHLDTRVKDVEVDVEKKRLTIRLVEYSPVFLWCPPQNASATTTLTAGCSFADETGHIFSFAPGYSGNPFLVFVTTTPRGNERAILPKEEFDKVSAFLQKLALLQISPRLIEQSGLHDFTIMTDKPWIIRWSSARDPEEDTRNLALVLQNLGGDHLNVDTLKAIDLRFGNKVFYK